MNLYVKESQASAVESHFLHRTNFSMKFYEYLLKLKYTQPPPKSDKTNKKRKHTIVFMVWLIFV